MRNTDGATPGSTWSRSWSGSCICIALALALSACAHTPPPESSLVDLILADKALRLVLVEKGVADQEFLHEILHQLGEKPQGNPQRLATLLADHLHHHPGTARAVFQELTRGREFQDWLTERLQGGQK